MSSISARVRRRLTFPGAAHDQRLRRNSHVLDDERPGRDDRSRADVSAVQQNRPHADQALRFNRAAVHDGAVADGDVVADRRRMGSGHHVHDRPVLNIRAPADADRVHIAPQHRAHPDAALLANLDVPDHLGRLVDECGRVHAGQDTPVRAKHYGSITVGEMERVWSRPTRPTRPNRPPRPT